MPDWRPVRSLITRTRVGRGLLSIAFYPFPAAQNPGPRGLDLGHFRSAPRTCCKSAVGWGCGKSPIGL